MHGADHMQQALASLGSSFGPISSCVYYIITSSSLAIYHIKVKLLSTNRRAIFAFIYENASLPRPARDGERRRDDVEARAL